MAKYRIVSVSKDASHKISNNKYLKALADEGKVDFTEISNNADFLTKIYNKQLLAAKEDSSCEFLILMHADVYLDMKSMIEHLGQCKDKYDIFGLCGTSIMNISQSPLNWWTSSNPTPQSKWGCVTHGELGNQTSYFSAHSPNILDHEVACIDGLCMIFNRKAIDSGISFDEQFAFDFYDTDISLQAVMKYNLKLGVIVEKSLQHYSVGKSILSEDFLRHEIDFRKKWNFEIPPNSPIRQLKS